MTTLFPISRIVSHLWTWKFFLSQHSYKEILKMYYEEVVISLFIPQYLGQKDPLEKEMVTHSSILSWRIPWREEPHRLQSTGSQRVGYDWVSSLHFVFNCLLFILKNLSHCVIIWLKIIFLKTRKYVLNIFMSILLNRSLPYSF